MPKLYLDEEFTGTMVDKGAQEPAQTADRRARASS